MTEIEHFLHAEIYMCQKRKTDISNFYDDFYDGERVGHKASKRLNDKHIDFCQHLLNLIRQEQETSE